MGSSEAALTSNKGGAYFKNPVLHQLRTTKVLWIGKLYLISRPQSQFFRPLRQVPALLTKATRSHLARADVELGLFDRQPGFGSETGRRCKCSLAPRYAVSKPSP
jgi:hypothetical protein